MEFKLKLKMVLWAMFFYIVLISIDWYGNMDYIAIRKFSDVQKVEDQELLRLNSSYDVDQSKDYNWESSAIIKKTKGDIPFTFIGDTLSKTEKKLVLNKY